MLMAWLYVKPNLKLINILEYEEMEGLCLKHA